MIGAGVRGGGLKITFEGMLFFLTKVKFVLDRIIVFIFRGNRKMVGDRILLNDASSAR